jgi:hypothetical protein
VPQKISKSSLSPQIILKNFQIYYEYSKEIIISFTKVFNILIGNDKFIIRIENWFMEIYTMEELKGQIESERLFILSKMILFNNYYAEYLLSFDNFKGKISYSRNHLFWSKNNELLESRNVGFYGFNKDESFEKILEDNQLKPLLISYLGIKAVLQNDKRIFEKWKLSFENLSEELNNSIANLKLIPKEKLEELQSLIKEINK